MRDKTRIWFGMCRFTVVCTLEDLINRASSFHIPLYQIESSFNEQSFYCSLEYRKKVKAVFPHATETNVTGVLGFLLTELKKPFHWILLCWVVLLYTLLNHTMIQVKWQSTSPSLQHKIELFLESEGITRGYFVSNADFDKELKKILKQKFVHELSWIEVKRKGSVLEISFNHKETRDVKTFERTPLLSFKHAMVVRFDVLHGNKKVSKYQIVAPNDVLVEPFLIDSSGSVQELFVEGKVYGITWYTVSSQIDGKTEVGVLDFVRLLTECRRQIQKEIDHDEQILKENILQVYSTEGTIRMVIHYTCYEDITKQ